MPAPFDRAPLPVFALLAGAVTVGLCWLSIGMNTPYVFVGAILLFIVLVSLFSIRISVMLLIFAMLLSPEIPLGQTASRAITVRLDDLLLLAMTIGWMLRMALFKDVGFTLKNPLNRPIVILSAIMVLSTSLGVARGNVDMASGIFFTLKLIEYFFLFNIVVNYVQDPKDIERTLSLMLIVCGIIVAYELFQLLIGGDIAAPFEGSTGEYNTLSGYLVLLGAVAAGVLLNRTNAFERTLLMGMIPLLLMILMVSKSRSGWVSAIVTIFVLFIVSRQKNIFFILILLVLMLLPFVLPDVVERRLDFTFNQGYVPGQQVEIFGIRLDTSSSARIFSALYVLKSFMNHPFLGHGITGFAFLDGQYFRTMAELGIVGLCAFVWLLATVHGLILKAMRLDDLPPRLKGMVMGFYAGFWGMLVHALTANTFIIVRIAEPFWCLAGLTVVTVLTHQQRDVKRETGSMPAVV